MSRLPLIQEDEASPELKEAYEMAKDRWGSVPNFYKTLAHDPRTLRNLIPFNSELQGGRWGSPLPMRTKELIILKTSMLNGCGY